jgi:hypothetical protein
MAEDKGEAMTEHANVRTVTYPADMVEQVAGQLCDLDWNLPGDEADEIARNIVIDVTLAVDKLRAREASQAS